MTKTSKRFPIGLTIATLIALAILIGLGVWQLERRVWKEDLLARIAALQAAPARPLADALVAGKTPDQLSFIRVKAVCPGLATAPYLHNGSVPISRRADAPCSPAEPGCRYPGIRSSPRAFLAQPVASGRHTNA